MRSIRAAALALAVAVPLVLSCQKNESETEKFERADTEHFKRDMSDLSSFTMANGITVYLQEEHTNDQIAFEVFYPTGIMNEPKGLPQVSHLAEHLMMYCANDSFATEEAFKLLNGTRGSMTNAETLGDFMHFDYIVKKGRFEDALRVEASRQTAVTCDADMMDREQKRVINELDQTIATPKLALTKPALMALNQAMNYGLTRVAVRDGVMRLTLDEVRSFAREHFQMDGVVMVAIGDFKKAEAEALIRAHFESIPRRPRSPAPVPKLAHDIHATWDANASAVFYVAPGPYGDFRERIILCLFGGFLSQFMSSSPELYTGNQVVYCTNPSYRVGEIPFFLYAQPTGGRTVAEVAPLLLSHLDRAIELLSDDARIESLKTGAISLMTSSMLKPDMADYPMSHVQVIGQEAVNLGIKHRLREGRSVDEFKAEVQAITPEQFRSVVKARLTRSKMFQVTFQPAR